MHVRRRLTVLSLGAVTIIILGTARGQVPAPAPTATASPSTAKTSTAVAANPKAQAQAAALPDLPADVFANPTQVAGQPGSPDPAQAKKQEHLQKIRQLMFDRRPSAILKAWSTPKEEAIKEAGN